MSDLLIGTSGYDYPEWKGVFYPEDLKRKDFLSYYATQFNALELNNTFYNMPTAERLLSFYERSEGRLEGIILRCITTWMILMTTLTMEDMRELKYRRGKVPVLHILIHTKWTRPR